MNIDDLEASLRGKEEQQLCRAEERQQLSARESQLKESEARMSREQRDQVHQEDAVAAEPAANVARRAWGP